MACSKFYLPKVLLGLNRIFVFEAVFKSWEISHKVQISQLIKYFKIWQLQAHCSLLAAMD